MFKLRGEMPDRIAALPRDARGYPVPYFVSYIDGVPEFRAIDPARWTQAVRQQLCWVCGCRLGRRFTFLIGPMCAVNRVTSEPPSHYECALFAALNCPFMVLPETKRRRANLAETRPAPGFHVERNPGVACLWTSNGYRVFRSPHGGQGHLLQLQEPYSVEWFAHGEPATRKQVDKALASGMELLTQMAAMDGPERFSLSDLLVARARVDVYLPLEAR